MANFNSNQFTQQRTAGELDLTTNPNPSVMTARFNPDSETDLEGFGVGVGLTDLGSDDSEGPPIVDVRSEDNDAIFGVRIFTTKQGDAEAGTPIEVAFKNAVVFMEAGEALDRGVKVSLDVSTGGEVQALDDFAEFGITLDKAGEAGDLIRVLITADGITEGTAT